MVSGTRRLRPVALAALAQAALLLWLAPTAHAEETGQPPERMPATAPAKNRAPARKTLPPRLARNKPGALVYRSGEGSIGTLGEVAEWKVERRHGRLNTLTRETELLRERVLTREEALESLNTPPKPVVPDGPEPLVRLSDLEPPSPFEAPAAPPPPAAPPAKVDAERVATKPASTLAADACAQQGLCRVALRAGKRLDYGDDNFLEARARLQFKHTLKLCHVGPVLRLEPKGHSDDWLAPAIFSYATEGRPLLVHQKLLEVTESASDQSAQPPACNAGKEGWRKLVSGGEYDAARTGQFLMSQENASVINGAAAIDGQQAFELAKKLAVNAFVYNDRWCDDAVRQIVFADEGDANVQRSLEEVTARHWDDILLRHALLYMEYAPDDCKRALRRMHQSKRIAAEQKLVHLHLTY